LILEVLPDPKGLNDPDGKNRTTQAQPDGVEEKETGLQQSAVLGLGLWI
jgi:hypothetical protein